MNDQEAWQQGIRFMEEIHGRLPRHVQQQLAELLDRYRRHKREMLILTAGSCELCRACGGQCCWNGKYRFNGLDLLALFDRQAPLPVPDFAQRPLCPYGTVNGCCMEPPYRPLDCVLFICDAIEERLSGTAAQSLALLEDELRRCLRQAETLLNQPLGRPLLLLAGHPGGTARRITTTHYEDTPWSPPTTSS